MWQLGRTGAEAPLFFRFLLITAATGCGKQATVASRGESLGETAMKEHCLGRFQCSLPAEFREVGRTDSIYHVDVNTVPLSLHTADMHRNDRRKAIDSTMASSDGSRPVQEPKIENGSPAGFYTGRTWVFGFRGA
jgi:hypothetical protein